MLSLLARAAAGPLRSLGRSPFCSLAPWWRRAAAPVSRALPLWCGAAAAAPRALLARPLPAPHNGLLPPPPPCAGLKSKTSLKRRCKDCFIVRRRGRLYVYCKTNPRHKQRKL
ncbi:large ribosomal subunit protein bL36m [Phalacrocorax carbo]|uniref:large ribosomal subunit protein bL36m n=1 Tax=Phalacrocorax carbo TaxID=9209 RepID=UPI00311A694B